MPFSHLEQCGQLAQPDLETAVSSREECAALLTRMSEISARDTGAAAVLSVFAALASAACDWLDGDLVIDMVEDDEITSVSVLTDLGGDMREKVFHSPFTLKVPLSEITAAVDKTPDILGALKLRRISWRRISLSANEEVRRSTMPPRIGSSDASAWMLDKLAAKPNPKKP
jgi:hypothetical protein